MAGYSHAIPLLTLALASCYITSIRSPATFAAAGCDKGSTKVHYSNCWNIVCPPCLLSAIWRDYAESGNPWPVWYTIATIVANFHPTVDLNALYQRWEEVVTQCNVSELVPFAYVPFPPPFDEIQRNVSQHVFVSSGFLSVLRPSPLVEQWQSMDKVLGEALLWLQRSPVSCAVFEECQECNQNYLCAKFLDTECKEVNSWCGTCQRPRVYYRQEEDRSEDGSESERGEDTDLEWDSEALGEDEEAELEEELKWLAVSGKFVDDVIRVDGRLPR
ncbi:hypothetical protein BDD12DRAFT_240825 [Trichophaea hybrida]|nr:hypothetical protein BDD12DRAFT_240825 [Trichophaea hybrida]